MKLKTLGDLREIMTLHKVGGEPERRSGLLKAEF